MSERKRFWEKSKAYNRYRGIQKPWAFKAWAKKNQAEREQVERKHASQRPN